MDFTAGLMPLDTALAQMLDRITPPNGTAASRWRSRTSSRRLSASR
ncbi:hypothetical protein ACLBO2_17495, partial [Klebsiella pneumoniae]